MGNIKPKQLSKLGYTDNRARSIAIETVSKHCKHYTAEQIESALQQVRQTPEAFRLDAVWGKLAELLSPQEIKAHQFDLRDAPLPYHIYGADNTDDLAKLQMATAMRLSVSVAGALMPDGCAGYGLPIGGVLATKEDVVIPYAVGKDIACSMYLTILDANADYLVKHHDRAIDALVNKTAFGLDGTLPCKHYHPLTKCKILIVYMAQASL